MVLTKYHPRIINVKSGEFVPLRKTETYSSLICEYGFRRANQKLMSVRILWGRSESSPRRPRKSTIRSKEYRRSVVSLGLSSSSDEHHLSLSCLGTGLRVGKLKRLCRYRASLVHWHLQIVSLSCVGVLVGVVPRYCHFWYRLFGPTHLQQFWFVCVNELATVSRYCYCGARVRDGRSTVSSRSLAWNETITRQWDRVDEEHGSGTTFWTGPTSKFLSANSGLHLPTMEVRPSTLAGDLFVAEEPAG